MNLEIPINDMTSALAEKIRAAGFLCIVTGTLGSARGDCKTVLVLHADDSELSPAEQRRVTEIVDPSCLSTTMSTINRAHGANAIMQLSTPTAADPPIRSIPTGIPALDAAIGIGGYPRGRIVELYSTAGRSSGSDILFMLAMATITACQRAGGVAAFIDMEHGLSLSALTAAGVAVDRLLVSQPDNGEQAMEVVEMLARSGAVDLIVVDSVGALLPRDVIDGGEGGSGHYGAQGRLLSRALRKLTAAAYKTETTIIFLNRLRAGQAGVMAREYGADIGNGLKFYSSVRVDVRVIDGMAHATVVKNKCAAPFQRVEWPI